MFRIGGIAYSPGHILAMLDPGSPHRCADRSSANDSNTHEYLLVSHENQAKRFQRCIRNETQPPNHEQDCLGDRDILVRSLAILRIGRRTAESSSGQLVEKKIKGGNPAVPSNDEISPGVSWRLTRAARYPLDPPAIAQFLGPGNWLISKVRVSSLDRAGDAIDLVVATVNAPAEIVEHAIFGEYLVDGRAPTRGVVFTEDVLQIAGQQGRDAG